MRSALAYERFRWCRTRSVWIIAALAIVGSAGIAWVMSTMMMTTHSPTSVSAMGEAVTVAVTRSPLAPIAAGVLGVMVFGQESRHRTLLYAVLVVPRRRTLFYAKVIIAALVSIALCALCMAAALAVSYAVISAGSAVGLAAPLPWVLIGYFGQTMGWCLLGLGAGAAMPQLAGILALVLGSTVIEPLIGQLTAGINILGNTPIAQFLPFSAGTAMLSITDAELTMNVLAEDSGSLSPVGAAAVFSLYVAVALILGLQRFRRQDV